MEKYYITVSFINENEELFDRIDNFIDNYPDIYYFKTKKNYLMSNNKDVMSITYMCKSLSTIYFFCKFIVDNKNMYVDCIIFKADYNDDVEDDCLPDETTDSDDSDDLDDSNDSSISTISTNTSSSSDFNITSHSTSDSTSDNTSDSTSDSTGDNIDDDYDDYSSESSIEEYFDDNIKIIYASKHKYLLLSNEHRDKYNFGLDMLNKKERELHSFLIQNNND